MLAAEAAGRFVNRLVHRYGYVSGLFARSDGRPALAALLLIIRLLCPFSSEAASRVAHHSFIIAKVLLLCVLAQSASRSFALSCGLLLGQQLAVACEDGITYMYHLAISRVWRVLRGHSLRVNAIAFHSDGNWMATGSTDKVLRPCLVPNTSLTVGAD